MTRSFSLRAFLACAGVAVATLTASAVAQAQNNNVYWSIGMSAPGVHVGVANAPPVVYPQVVYPHVVAPPVYVAPSSVGYYGYNGYYAPPAPVYYAPPVWRPGFGHGHHVGHGQGHRMGHHFDRGHGHRGGHGGGYRH